MKREKLPTTLNQIFKKLEKVQINMSEDKEIEAFLVSCSKKMYTKIVFSMRSHYFVFVFSY